MHSLGVDPSPIFRIAKFGPEQTIETSFYRMVQSVFRYLEPLGVSHECDGQTWP